MGVIVIFENLNSNFGISRSRIKQNYAENLEISYQIEYICIFTSLMLTKFRYCT